MAPDLPPHTVLWDAVLDGQVIAQFPFPATDDAAAVHAALVQDGYDARVVVERSPVEPR